METHKPLTVELLAYAPVIFSHCQHCELIWQQSGMRSAYQQDQLDASLPDDLKQEYQQISDWAREMIATYRDRIVVRVIDAASIEGWLKSVRYGIHDYPAVIVDHKEKITGLNLDRATASIRERME